LFSLSRGIRRGGVEAEQARFITRFVLLKDIRWEHLRRYAEVARILLDAGVILIVTAIELTREDLELIQTTVHSDKIETIWIGEKETTDIPFDLKIKSGKDPEAAVGRIRAVLEEKSIVQLPAV
jgi:bifunctional enzyme CysN/CysC